MVVYGKELLLCGRKRLSRTRLGLAGQVKLAATQARSYSDDSDIQHGALSLPRIPNRPGSRDDTLRCSSTGFFAAV